MRFVHFPHLLLPSVYIVYISRDFLCSLFFFFFSPLTHGKISTPKDTARVIEFVHVEKQYKPEKYLMPGILYTCQIA